MKNQHHWARRHRTTQSTWDEHIKNYIWIETKLSIHTYAAWKANLLTIAECLCVLECSFLDETVMKWDDSDCCFNHNFKWNTKQWFSSSASIILLRTIHEQFIVYEWWPSLWLQTHILMNHSVKLDRHKPWPCLPFPPSTDVAVSQKAFLCWLSLVQHSSAFQSRQTQSCRGSFHNKPCQCMLVWQSVVLDFETGKDGEVEFKVCVCVCACWMEVTRILILCDVTFSLFCGTECACLATVCSKWCVHE